MDVIVHCERTGPGALLYFRQSLQHEHSYLVQTLSMTLFHTVNSPSVILLCLKTDSRRFEGLRFVPILPWSCILELERGADDESWNVCA